MPSIAIIAAVSENGVIGRDNALPWRLRADLQNFRSITMEKPVIMGRRTYESLPGPLPDRKMIVLTSRSDFQPPPRVCRAASLADAIAIGTAPRGAFRAAHEVMIIGGAAVFAEALPIASRIYLTTVHAVVDGTVFFPRFDPADYQQVAVRRQEADEHNEFPHTFTVLQRSLRAAA